MYLKAEVCSILDLKENTLEQWVNRGFVKPHKPADGSGSRNIFSEDDINKLRVFKKLATIGLSLKVAAKMAFSEERNIYIGIMIKDLQQARDAREVG